MMMTSFKFICRTSIRCANANGEHCLAIMWGTVVPDSVELPPRCVRWTCSEQSLSDLLEGFGGEGYFPRDIMVFANMNSEMAEYVVKHLETIMGEMDSKENSPWLNENFHKASQSELEMVTGRLHMSEYKDKGSVAGCKMKGFVGELGSFDGDQSMS